jgi:hypothetical protein
MNIWQISHKIKQRTTALRCDVKVAQHTVERSVSVYSGPSGSSSILVMVNLSEMIFASKSQQMDHSACFSCFFAGNEKTVSPKLTKNQFERYLQRETPLGLRPIRRGENQFD